MEIKFKTILQFAKPTISKIVDSRYVEFEDKDGWSNGFMADFDPIHAMEVKEKVKKSKMNYASDRKAKVQPLIDRMNAKPVELVTSIEWDLDNGWIVLKTGKLTAKVNAYYLSYFTDKYNGDFKLFVSTDKRTAVALMQKDKLIGMLMPILEN